MQMPGWVSTKIEQSYARNGTDWRHEQVQLSDEFRSVMPGLSRALESAATFSAQFAAVGEPGDSWYNPASRRWYLFTQTSDDVLVWILDTDRVEPPANASHSLALFLREVGSINFVRTAYFGYLGTTTDPAEWDCEPYEEAAKPSWKRWLLRRSFTPFPYRESLWVGHVEDTGDLVEYRGRIYSLSVNEDDFAWNAMGAGSGVPFNDGSIAYSSDTIRTFADLAERIVAVNLGEIIAE